MRWLWPKRNQLPDQHVGCNIITEMEGFPGVGKSVVALAQNHDDGESDYVGGGSTGTGTVRKLVYRLEADPASSTRAKSYEILCRINATRFLLKIADADGLPSVRWGRRHHPGHRF